MAKPNIQIDNVVREMTDDEYKVFAFATKQYEDNEAKRIAKAEARESALAKLAALGLTEDEIAAL